MITGFYAGLAAITIIVLAARVSRLRRRHRVGTGTGGHDDLDVAIRCHGNAIENLPLGLILLYFAEVQGMGMVFIHLFGLLLVSGRILHTWGMTVSNGGVAFGRLYGTVFTWLAILSLGIYLVYRFLVSLL